MMGLRLSRLALASLALFGAMSATACQREVKITVQALPASSEFDITQGGQSLCVPGLHVTDITSKEPRRWDIVQTTEASKAGICTHRFVYGVAPDGYATTSATAPPLVAGHRYKVSVSGHGLVGQTEFVAR